jgi:hypothetical protein
MTWKNRIEPLLNLMMVATYFQLNVSTHTEMPRLTPKPVSEILESLMAGMDTFQNASLIGFCLCCGKKRGHHRNCPYREAQKFLRFWDTIARLTTRPPEADHGPLGPSQGKDTYPTGSGPLRQADGSYEGPQPVAVPNPRCRDCGHEAGNHIGRVGSCQFTYEAGFATKAYCTCLRFMKDE